MGNTCFNGICGRVVYLCDDIMFPFHSMIGEMTEQHENNNNNEMIKSVLWSVCVCVHVVCDNSPVNVSL